MANEDEFLHYLKKAAADLRDARQQIQELEARDREPIAIVSMACRLPGGVDSPESLWDLVAAGRDGVSAFPIDRGWDLEGIYDPDPDHPGTTYARDGGFLDDAAGFDPAFFGISPREALAMDPQQRLLLETTWEVLERAGIDPAALRGSRTGVFTGVIHNDYADWSADDTDQLEGYLGNGSAASVASGRVSYTFGFEGPAVSLDTACSSSLVALHLAIQALRSGECTLAITGGVTVLASVAPFIEFSRQRGLADDGRCKAFAADANGFGMAEGIGLLLVERLSDAQRLGHPVLAVVRGTAVNQDGASNGLTAPNGPSQQRVIRDALTNAQLTATDIDLVEAHGTGTKLGDPIEAQAIIATYGQHRDQPVRLGSLKSNIGHAQAAAGVAGIIKTVMAMRHGIMPRTLHIDEPTPEVDWTTGTVELLTESRDWPTTDQHPRRAAVSSFGVSGTNAHVILEQAPTTPEPHASEAPPAGPVPWILSAHTEPALRELARRLVTRHEESVTDVAYSLLHGRAALPCRAVMIGSTREDFAAELEALTCGSGRASKVVFVFPGQGSQWIGMGRGLWESSAVFRDSVLRTDRALAEFVDWSAAAVLAGEPGTPDLDRVDVVQPVLFTVMVALANVWRSYGVEPAAVVGHSQGEIAAAHVAGGLSLRDAARVVALRSRALTALAGEGGMVVVQRSVAYVENLLRQWEGRLSVAVVNGPEAVVVSGQVAALEELLATEDRARRVAVDYASHSAQVERIEEKLTRTLTDVQPMTSRVPLFSTVERDWIDTASMDTGYWYRNLRQTVWFDDAVGRLSEAGFDVFVEVSPHPVLTASVRESCPEAVVTGTLRRDHDDVAALLAAARELHVGGAPVDWVSVVGEGRRVDLPTYPFQRDRYWLERGSGSGGDAAGLGLLPTRYPLLGAVTTIAGSGAVVLSGRLSVASMPWLADHAVAGTVVLPGTALVDMVIRAGDEVGCDVLDELVVQTPLVLDRAASVQVSVGPTEADGRRPVSVHARRDDGDWVEHAVGSLAEEVNVPVPPPSWPPAGAEEVDLTGLYERLADGGLAYGPAFQGLEALWRQDGSLYAEVALPDAAGDAAGYAVHPALFDAALHAVVGTAELSGIRLPFAWTGVAVHATDATRLRVRLDTDDTGAVRLLATDTTGEPVVTVDALVTRPVTADQLRRADSGPDGLYAVEWVSYIPATPGTVPVFERYVVEPTGDDVVADTHRATTDTLAHVQRHLTATTTPLVVQAPYDDLAGAAVWGLLRTAQTEHPGRIVLVDTDDHPASQAVLPALVASGEPQARIRDGAITLPRLARLSADTESVAIGDGTILITGGTGSLGSLVARHLVTEHGVRDLVLVSRQGPDADSATELAAELQQHGARVRTLSCDLTDRTALATLIDEIGPLTGVVHTAGALADATVEHLDAEALATTFAPKANTAWWLHELTQDHDLTLFALFSSVAGILGSPGQANYAAANTFLDALATHRRGLGLPGTSLAWGSWQRVGGLTRSLGATDRNRQARAGLRPLSDAEGTALFDAALAAGTGPVVAARLDLAALGRAEAMPELLRDLVVRRGRRQAGNAGDASWADRVSAMAPQDRMNAVVELVRGQVASVLGHSDARRIAVDQAFKELGFDSLTAVELRNQLTAATGLRLPATLIFDYPTTAAVAGLLAERLSGRTASAVPDPRVAPVSATDSEPIAIVGMACRLPGGVTSPEELWELLSSGGDGISGFPTDRGWDLEHLYHPDPDHPGTSYVREGGFLHDAGDFDAALFGISPREALTMDPQQRLLLETTWEVLERAGIDPTSLRGSRTGVFAGVMYHDYISRLRHFPSELEGYTSNGGSGSVVSGRVSYTFGFEGPAVSVDTACSSSLVALHLAVQALRTGECTLAVAGGVTVMASPSSYIEFSRQRGLSPDGRCKSFAADADGAAWSEGAGLLLVERLSDAQRLGHPVLGVVRGTAVNQDGASNGLTAPNGPSQQRVINTALADARLTAADVDVVEAHGTGTKLGDPIEAQAIIATYGQDREQPLWMGSLKSNIGHTQAAAGVAGVMKAVLSMRHGVMPKSLHIDEPTPEVDWSAGAVELLAEARDWPATGRPRRAGVSSFGASGTNAHVVLEQAPEAECNDAAEDTTEQSAPSGPVPWVLSAQNETALKDLARQLVTETEGTVHQIAHSLITQRSTTLPHRAVLVGSTREEFATALEQITRHTPDGGKTVLVFPGQGSQWVGMGQRLWETSPLYRDTIHEIDTALSEYIDWSVTDILTSQPGAPTWDRVDVIQPVLFTTMTALATLWQHHGLTPDAIIGHSQGEIAAAYTAGALTLQDAARITTLRSKALLPLTGHGTMISVLAPPEKIQEIADPDHWNTRIWIAAHNAPNTTTITGDTQAITHLTQQLSHHRIMRWQLPGVDFAGHSGHIDQLHNQLQKILAPITPQKPTIPFYSTTDNTWITDTTLDADYWYRNLRQPVLFQPAINHLTNNGYTTYIETSPHPTLTPSIQETNPNTTTIHTLHNNQNDTHALLTALGHAHTHGHPITWHTLIPPTKTTPLPTYPFQHTRYWLNDKPTVDTQDATQLGLIPTPHPLVPATTTLAETGATILTGHINPAHHPWTTDHAVNGTPLLPGTALVDMALHAGDHTDHTTLDELIIHTPITLTHPTTIQLTISPPDNTNTHTLTVHTRNSPDGPWTAHATGTLTQHQHTPDPPQTTWPPTDAEPIPLDGTYQRLATTGLEYGPTFQGLHALWRRDSRLFADVRLPNTDHTDSADGYGIHPALLDAALHALVAVSDGDEIRLPFAWTGVTLHATGATKLRVELEWDASGSASLRAFDPSGQPVVTVESLASRVISPEQLRSASARSGPLYRPEWIAWSGAGTPGGAVEFERYEVPTVGDDVLADTHRITTETLTRIQQHLAADTTTPLVVEATHDDLAGAAVWGLIRTAQTEHPGRIILIDTDNHPTSRKALPTLIASGEPQARIRDGAITLPRLTVVAPTEPAGVGEGTVLITGGTGSLGSLIARHLVTEHGVRDLVLVSRQGPDAPGATELIAELQQLGAQVRVRSCDTTDRAALAALVDEVGPLTGVVHTAGALADATVDHLDADALATTFAPKAHAAWWLHELTQDHGLTLFMVFSSLASVLGSAGQANYAAANSFLDALATHRRTLGLPGTSLAWGSWERTSGMTAHLTRADHDRLARAGLRPLTDEQGLEFFDGALAVDLGQVVTATFDLPAIGRSGAVPVLLRGLVRAPRRAAVGADSGGAEPWTERIATLAPDARERSVLTSVIEQVAQALGHPDPGAIEPDQAFKSLGFDSLTAVEFRNRLSAMTGLQLPATLVFDYPAAGAVTRYLLDQVSPAPAAAGPDDDPDERELRRVLERVPVARFREAGVLEALLKLAGPDPARTPDAAEPDEDGLIDAMDTEALIRHVMDGTGA
ncbi:acyl transferase domain-containing protein/acyl carrier protein [Streptomyces rapamycinicus]|uniref:Acyl transferase domain-containing protein/acyl carrier protein n=2 Tax=Streptomyces rapamycinicus TaxID=1226757 RepID=A0ABR6M1A4_9ACTN|nr:type I polyketide synthase [Streptomyces rapamycinicus]MBB4787444.1 acyl transferase domain-containing protein/acyl carrier protein [Streptomyces rapamycinicus]